MHLRCSLPFKDDLLMVLVISHQIGVKFTPNWCEKDPLVEAWWKFAVLGVNLV
jgi:hypothetical protein